MTTNSTFNDSPVHGDVVHGDKHVSETALLPLEKAIKLIIANTEDDSGIEEIIEEFEEFTTDRPDRAIIGVEKKLENGDRQDLLKDAVYLKNKFERKIARRQLSLIDQKVYSHVLATISIAFNHKVRPLILEGRPKSDIDEVIHDEIIAPVYGAIVNFSPQITPDYVAGMLYFLTGKCHLLWSVE